MSLPHGPPAASRNGAEFDDPSIPVLTDRIYLPALELDIALPATPLSRTAEAPPAPAPVEAESKTSEETVPALIGATGKPIVAAAVEQAVVEVAAEETRAPGAEALAPAADEAGAEQQVQSEDDSALPTDLETDIETEIDRDLMTALDADLEAMLAAESEFEAAVERPTEPAAEEAPAAGAPAATAEIVAPSDTRLDRSMTQAGAAAETAGSTPEIHDTAETAPVDAPRPDADSAVEPEPVSALVEAEPVSDALVEATAASAAGSLERDLDIVFLPEPSAPEGLNADGEEALAPTDMAQQASGVGAEARGEAAAAAVAAVQPEREAAQADLEAPADAADRLRTAVLEAVARQLPAHIDTTLRDLMQPAIDKAITQLGEDAQVALRITLQQLVEDVLREQLARRASGDRLH